MLSPQFMRHALRLARRGYGATSPNPTVGAVVLVKAWRNHRARANCTLRGGPARGNRSAPRRAQKRGQNPSGATLYVTLEPCCTHGRTPPCTDAIISAGLKKVVVGATDPNPKHSGKAFKILRRAGIKVVHGILAEECERLNGRSLQSLDCSPHAVRHRKSRDDLGRKNRDGRRRIKMDHGRKIARIRNEIAPRRGRDFGRH